MHSDYVRGWLWWCHSFTSLPAHRSRRLAMENHWAPAMQHYEPGVLQVLMASVNTPSLSLVIVWSSVGSLWATIAMNILPGSIDNFLCTSTSVDPKPFNVRKPSCTLQDTDSQYRTCCDINWLSLSQDSQVLRTILKVPILPIDRLETHHILRTYSKVAGRSFLPL